MSHETLPLQLPDESEPQNSLLALFINVAKSNTEGGTNDSITIPGAIEVRLIGSNEVDTVSGCIIHCPIMVEITDAYVSFVGNARLSTPTESSTEVAFPCYIIIYRTNGLLPVLTLNKNARNSLFASNAN